MRLIVTGTPGVGKTSIAKKISKKLDLIYINEKDFLINNLYKNSYAIINKSIEMKTFTRGNVVVDDIKVGDIHYEFEYSFYIECKVLTLPSKNKSGQWEWTSKNTKTGETINYLVDPKYSHYSSKLYDYMAYEGCKQV